MSGTVQKQPANVSIESIAPIVLNSTEVILTFKTSSLVVVPVNVNSDFSSYNPTDWNYLIGYSSDSIYNNGIININQMDAMANNGRY